MDNIPPGLGHSQESSIIVPSADFEYRYAMVSIPPSINQMYPFLDALEHTLPRTKTSAVPLHFTGARKWEEAYEHDVRVTCKRDSDPATDPTLVGILQEREWWVGELYQAMLNLQHIRDPLGAEVKLFTPGWKHYDEKNIEAKCWIVFATIIDQVTNGYRGTRSQNFAKHKGNDRHGDVEQRIENVVQALKFDKRICRDVLQDPTRAADLAYAPLAVADRKLVNEKNNVTKREAMLQLKQKATVEISEEKQEQSRSVRPHDQLPRKQRANVLQVVENERALLNRDTTHADTDSDADGEYEVDSDCAHDDALNMFNNYAHPDPSFLFMPPESSFEHLFTPSTQGKKRSLEQFQGPCDDRATGFAEPEEVLGQGIREYHFREHQQEQTANEEKRQLKKHRRNQLG